MSAFVIRPRSWSEMADSLENCSNGCRVMTSGRASMFRAGTHEATILGRHAAFLCEPCAKAWRDAWMGGGGSRVTVRKASGVHARGVDTDELEVAA